MWSKSYVTLWVAAPHGTSPPYQIWWPSHCGSGDVFSCWGGRLQMFLLQNNAWKDTHFVNDSDTGDTCLMQQLEKKLKITFASPLRKNEKEKEKTWNSNCKAFCFTCKCKKCWIISSIYQKHYQLLFYWAPT